MAAHRNYIILRSPRAAEPSAVPESTTTEVPPGQREVSAEAQLEQAELSNADLVDVAQDPSVAAVAPDMPTRLIEPMASGAGPAAAAGPTWGVSAVGADTSPVNGQGIVVAVLDTGIDATHPAFQGVQLQEQDFTGEGNGDLNGHGTHCAGTIFGRDVSGTRIGVARGVGKALIGKVLKGSGGGTSQMLFDAINWASSSNVHVISMSLGFDFPGLVARLVAQGWPPELATSVALDAYRANLRMFDRLMAIVKARGDFGVSSLVVAASGNESQRPNFEISASLPAAADDVISVGALEQAGAHHKIASFSNTLPQISAPGVNVVSAKRGGGLVSLNGTSMACPHVAGVAALWWQVVRQSALPLKSEVVRARMLASARTNTLATGVDVADRGVGLATCPTTAQV